MFLREAEPMSAEAARLMNPLRLAYLGDTVWELLIRSRLVYAGKNVRHMHQGAIAGVNAQAQAQALHRVEPLLSPEESAIVLRGRNAHSRHPVPRHQSPADYQAATALEALIGYLYLTGQEERLLQLFQYTQQEAEPCQRSN